MDARARAVLCVCVLLFVAQVRSSHIPREMNQTIQNLLRRHYKISGREKYNGKPVFSREPLFENENEVKKVFLGGVLEIYGKLFNKMLDQLPTPVPSVDSPANVNPNANTGSSDNVRTDLKYISEMVHKLKKRYLGQVKVVDELKALHNIETDNFVNQSKALGELPWLYEEASSLLNNDKKRRQRRQTPGAKKKAKV